MNFYHVIYSLFYSLSQKMNGRDNAPVYNACLGLSIIVLLNATTLFLIIDYFFKIDYLIEIGSTSKLNFVFYGLVFFLINYFYFKIRKVKTFDMVYFGGRYMTASFLAGVYIAASFVLFCLMMFVGFNARHGG
jgi:hypothetical protein